MKIKTIKLAGHALDWAVAKCEGIAYQTPFKFEPSKFWAQGGPIIEREIVCIDCEAGRKRWKAYAWRGDGDLQSALGETPLIAAMRCYVASKLGDEVEVPDELIA